MPAANHRSPHGQRWPPSIRVCMIGVPFDAFPVIFRTEGTEAGKATEGHGETPVFHRDAASPRPRRLLGTKHDCLADDLRGPLWLYLPLCPLCEIFWVYERHRRLVVLPSKPTVNVQTGRSVERPCVTPADATKRIVRRASVLPSDRGPRPRSGQCQH